MTAQPSNQDDTPSNIPIPDPTVRTREQLVRELGLLRNELTREIAHVSRESSARMDAMDAATRLRLDALNEVRPQTARLIEAHGQLVNERFASVYRMFEERDVRTQQASEAGKQALDAALAAAKELVTAQALAAAAAAEKAEMSTTKQIDQIGLRLEALRDEQNQRREADQKAQNQRVDEIKERIDRGEGAKVATVEGRDKFSQNWAMILGAILAVIGVVSLILGVVNAGTP